MKDMWLVVSFRYSLRLAMILLVFAAFTTFLNKEIFAQGGGAQHYNSPLYSPRTYEDRIKEGDSSNGLPKALDAVGIEQKLDAQIPLDTKFFDENGKEVTLNEYFGKGKPIVLAFVYYECPMLCSEVLNGMTRTLKGLPFTVGKEFDVVAISFDARDKPEVAKAKKAAYIANYGYPETANGWHFLTAKQESIDTITKSVGFNYRWDEETKQFAHAGAIMLATPEGKLSHYFYGIDYAPKDLKLGLVEASANKIGSPVEQLMLYCFHYDPAKGKYGFAILNGVRLGGIVTLLGLGTMMLFMRRYNKNKKAKLEGRLA